MISDSLPVLSAKSIDNYIQSVRMIPNMTFEEEQALSEDHRVNGNLDAAKKLVMSNLKSVVFVASKYKNYGFDQAELIQEGNIGLMKAVKNFDPGRGIRLFTYATHWISAEITDYVIRNFRQVKIATTKAQRKLFFNLRKLKKSTTWMKDDEISFIANHLDVSPDDVRQMEGRLYAKDLGFHAPSEEDENGNFATFPENYLGTTDFSGESYLEAIESSEKTSALMRSISELDGRLQDIVKSRWLPEGDKLTLHDLAAKHGVSAERIRQLEKTALGKIRGCLESV